MTGRYDYSPETTGITVRIVDDLEPLREPSGAMRQVDRTVSHVGTILAQLDLALAIIYRLLPRDSNGEAVGVSFDSFRTDCGPRAQIIKNGTGYDVSKRKVNGS